MSKTVDVPPNSGKRYDEDHHGYARLKGIGVVAERLLQVVAKAAPDLAVVGFLPPCGACLGAAASYGDVYGHDAVPLLDLTRAPDPRAWWPACKGRCRMSAATAHPTWEWHQLYAEAVVWALADAALRPTSASPPNTTRYKPEDLAKFPTCDAGGTYASAYDVAFRGACAAAPGVAAARDCALTEDRPGKPGFVLSGDGAFVEFDVDFGAQPTLTVSYLRSYAGFGTARLRLNGATYDLVAKTGGSTTQTHAEFFAAGLDRRVDQTHSMKVAEAQKQGRPLADAGAKGFGVKKGARRVPLRITLTAGDKFKVVAVASC